MISQVTSMKIRCKGAGVLINIKGTLEVVAAVHNVHFGYYDGPVVKMALYMLQGHIM